MNFILRDESACIVLNFFQRSVIENQNINTLGCREFHGLSEYLITL